VTAVTRNSAQVIAPFALVFSLSGCASSSAASSARAGALPDAPEVVIDAVLPAGEGFRVFQLGTLRHAKIPGNPEAWAGGTPAVAPASSGSSAPSVPGDTASVVWLKLAAPAGAFRPVQTVPAQRGYFLLVDAASARLCLYDDGAGLISTFPLPEAFTPFPAGRAAVFRGADGAFTFVDYAAGEAWQFADRQTSGAGTTQWISRGRVKLPAGARACMQPPGSEELFCRGGDGSPLRFDGALNRVSARSLRDGNFQNADPDARTLAVWDAATGEWTLEGRATDGTTLFRFLPAQKRWQRPLSTESPADSTTTPSTAPSNGSSQQAP
jgi:hypothetical protein